MEARQASRNSAPLKTGTHTLTATIAGHHGRGDVTFTHDITVSTGAASQARRVERGLEQTLKTNPLALGAVALAVGAAVGYSLPRTERENALMGEARDHLLDGASHLAHDASQSLFQIASEAGDSVKEVISAVAK